MLVNLSFRLMTVLIPVSLLMILGSVSAGQQAGGGVLAFYLDDETQPGMYLLDVTTGVLHHVNHQVNADTLFAWSPDGEYFAVPQPPVVETRQFTEDDIVETVVEAGQMVILQANGREAGRISTDNASAKKPRWSPDGRWIAFEADDDTGRQDMFLVVADGTVLPLNLTNTPDALEEFAVWSPDSAQLAYQSIDLRGTRIDAARYIYLVNPDGTEKRRVFDNALFPSWSPDGSRLVYFHWSEFRALMLTDFQSASMLDTGLYSAAVWSPDGTGIAYVREIDGFYRLRVVDTDGQIQRDVMTDFGSITSPVWSPDSQKIAFGVLHHSGQSDYALYVLDMVSGEMRHLLDTPGMVFPVWKPQG